MSTHTSIVSWAIGAYSGYGDWEWELASENHRYR